MTGRRRWSKFSLRFLLIFITAIGLLLATFSHYRAEGNRRAIAADSMLEIDVAPFSVNDTVTFQDFTFTGSSTGAENSMKITLPTINKGTPGSVEELGRNLFGNQIFDDYGFLLVRQPVEEKSEFFLNQLNALQNVKTIYYHPNTLNDTLVANIQENRPAIKLTELEGDAVPRLPRR